jgi:hypothetical protein
MNKNDVGRLPTSLAWYLTGELRGYQNFKYGFATRMKDLFRIMQGCNKMPSMPRLQKWATS